MNRKVIVTLIVLCAILLGSILFYIKSQEQKMKTSIDGRTEANQLLLNGVGIFSDKYTGELKTTDVMKKIKEVTSKDIVDLYGHIKRYDEKKLENYYNENKSKIKKSFGINDVKKFIEFAQKIQSSNRNFKKYYKVDIIKESFIDNSDKKGYAYVEYTETFEDDTKLKYSIYVSHKEDKDILYIIDIIQ